MASYSVKDKILDILHNDCRLSLEQIATMVGKSPAELGRLLTALKRTARF